MSQYNAQVEWSLTKQDDFKRNQYSRAHTWQFDGGVSVPASSSPHVVPLPYSIESAVDPEEAFIASLASCHMLWFLSIAAKAGYVVTHYVDRAEGTMAMNQDKKLAITDVMLRPIVTFDESAKPNKLQLDCLHHEAHEACFIANSVKTKVHIHLD